MPKIKFTVTPTLPHDIAHLAYAAGQEVEFERADSAARWVNRGVAVYVPADGHVDANPVVAAAFTEAIEVAVAESESAVPEVEPVPGTDPVSVAVETEPAEPARRGRRKS